MTHEELYNQSGVQVESGSFGRNTFTGTPRHYGDFTDNNPYYQQLKNNPNMPKEDVDALYAQAVEWQANYFNTLEERDYNSPVNKLAREKLAGINSDILGATAGSGSSSTPGSAIQSPQSGVEYSNKYSNIGSITDSISSASSLLSSVASFGTATIGAIRDIKTLPSAVSLAESQAYIADQTKDEVVQSSSLSNIQSRLALVNQLSSFFTPESTTEEYANVLGTLGISLESIPQYENAIRNYHSNPAYRASYEDSLFRANDSAAHNAIYTSDVLNELYDKTLSIQSADQSLSLLQTSIQAGINSYLVDNGYIEHTGENIVEVTSAQSDAISLSRSHLKRDISAFSQNLDDVKESIHGMDSRIQAIVGNAKNERRMLSNTEQFEIDTLNNIRNQLLTLGSSQLQGVYSLINNANAIIYQNMEMLNNEGNPIINAVTPRYLRTINTTFGNIVSSDTDVLTSLIQTIPFVGSLFSNNNTTGTTTQANTYSAYVY